ncbi:MAG TPA: aldo/keto reductase [Polyangiaceae bacterium]|nr:aldo/keto reductase [Polyangiaceae bacterium]
MKHQNRLASETSPYLLQHAGNPVDWYPWGPEALGRAAAENKPILLSIGYAACHWCHVMERESFENEAIAALMNESFVCIKVDREERPDLDEIYMAATVALSGSGGWPMTVFLTPEQQPFFAGTYFPPVDKYGRPGLPTLLQNIKELWQSERNTLLEQAAELAKHIADQARVTAPLAIGREALRSAARQLHGSYDSRYGGFGKAPKFPPCSALSLLLRHHRNAPDPSLLEMITGTLDGMKNGGMYDHVGGGFARYSTDERWLVPHFEKMLYDNAQLASVYLDAYQVTRDPEYARVARETLDYVIREMQEPNGAYFSATDADSEGVEGKFFVWALDEVLEILGPEAGEHFAAYYDVTAKGNWEGQNVLNTPRPLARVADELGVPEGVLRAELDRSRKQLYQARKLRVPPLLDDKILSSWNGLMLSAMASGYGVLGHRHYLDSAERAADSLLSRMTRPDGGLFHTARGARAHVPGFLEDYALLCDGLIALYEAGGAPRYLHAADRLAQRMLADFDDAASGAFFNTAKDAEALISRPREGHDNALPNANAVAARALAKLAAHLDKADYRERAAAALRAYGKLVERSPRSFATSLSVVDFLLQSPVEIVLAGTPGEAGYEALRNALGQRYLPNAIFAHVDPTKPDAAGESLPLTRDKAGVSGKAAVYVCQNFTCAAPVVDVADLDQAVAAAVPAKSAQSIARNALSGRATADGTRTRTERLGARARNELADSGLFVSGIGFGGYRVDDQHPEQRAALVHALRSGINLIDTASNYADGRSERLIGEVLLHASDKRELSRAELVVVTKIGYVQNQNLELSTARKAIGKPLPEMVEYSEGLWHCIHPEWLADQLGRSLERLNLETVDVLLLHNPEYFLADAAKRGQGPLATVRDEFYRRLEQAFRHLETEVDRGRIGYYGVSSNTVTGAPAARDSTEFARMWAAAEAAAPGKHHFRVLQVPLNLLESSAAFEQGGAASLLAQAQARGVAVLANRPLNAIRGGSILRLVEPNRPEKAPKFDFVRGNLLALEREFRETIAPSLELGGGLEADDLFAWGDRILEIEPRVSSLVQWEEIEAHVIAPELGKVLKGLDHALSGELAERFRDFRGRYLRDLEGLFLAMRNLAADRSAGRLRSVRSGLEAHLEPALSAEPLSRQALVTLRGVPGVSSVLLGARSVPYVDDALAALALPKPKDAIGALSALREN